MSATSSNAKVFFEELFSDPSQTFEKLKQLVDQRGDENEWREFKGVQETTRAEGSERTKKIEELRSNWSKAIGAFANSSGGVLVWGIAATDKFATNFSLAKDANELAAQLSEWVNSAALPHVAGIDIRAVKDGTGPQGLVVCLIPASRFAPHQSMWPRRQFYMRCQDGSHECGYTELRRMFQPTLKPAFALNAQLRAEQRSDGALVLSGALWLKNIGSASAHDVFFIYQGQVQLAPCIDMWSNVVGVTCGLKTAWSIHPGQTIQVASNVFRVIQTADLGQECALQFQTRIYVRDAPRVLHRFAIKSVDLLSASETHRPFKVIGEDISLEAEGEPQTEDLAG